jgi:hypothetical protein
MLKIAPQFLFTLNGFEKRLKIPLSETLRALALDDLKEECRPVFYGLAEQLQEISLIIAIYQNAEFLKGGDILVDWPDTIEQIVVI